MRPGRPILAAALLALLAACVKSEDLPRDPELSAPFADASAFGPVNEAFSTTAAAPWGFAHDGIDFAPNANGTPLYAVAEGTVTERTLWRNPVTDNWQVNLGVRYNDRYVVEYVFEPFSAVTVDGEAQSAAVPLRAGDVVGQGQGIGSVKVIGGGAHLHLGLKKDDVSICPEPYFTAEARAAVLDLIRRDHPAWAMCY